MPTWVAFPRGHYITNPNNALLEGKSLKITIDLSCLILPKWVAFNDPSKNRVGFRQPFRLPTFSEVAVMAPEGGSNCSPSLWLQDHLLSFKNKLQTQHFQLDHHHHHHHHPLLDHYLKSLPPPKKIQHFVNPEAPPVPKLNVTPRQWAWVLWPPMVNWNAGRSTPNSWWVGP